MNYCLVCHEEVSRKATWFTVVTSAVVPLICDECLEQFQLIEGETCRICCRPFTAKVYKVGDCCYDCFRWEEEAEWRGVLRRNQSIYVYNQYMKKVVSQFKFRGDIVLAHLFEHELQSCFVEQFSEVDIIVPIPLSKERLYERGFNQALVLAECIGHGVCEPLVRVHTEKQSKKSREERIHLDTIFQCVANDKIKGKHVLLIDYIYTTGSTLRGAAKVLRECGASEVSSLTLAR